MKVDDINVIPEDFDAPWLKRFFKAKFGLEVRVRSLSGKTQYIDIWIPGNPELAFPGWFGNLCLREIYGNSWVCDRNWAGNVNPKSITMSRPQWRVVLQLTMGEIMKDDSNQIYLGDGVYAKFDGFGIMLDLRGQDNTTFIALEEQVFDNLVKWGNEKFSKSPNL